MIILNMSMDIYKRDIPDASSVLRDYFNDFCNAGYCRTVRRMQDGWPPYLSVLQRLFILSWAMVSKLKNWHEFMQSTNLVEILTNGDHRLF